MQEPNVLDVPTEPWLDRLRRGHMVWLVKEKEYARIAFAWEPPEPGYRTGHIGITKLWGPVYDWFIDINGRGLDGTQLFAPTEGSLPTEAGPISEPVVRHIHRELERQRRELERQGKVLAELIMALTLRGIR